MTLTPTPGQTIGPFFGYSLPYPGDSELVPVGHRDAIRLHGTVYDGAGEPIPDALLEIWQADQHGQVSQAEGSLRRDGYTFTGFGRAAVDANGHYSFTTVRPGPTHDGAAPFIAMTVFARGLTNRLFTRIYLPVGRGGTRGRRAAAVAPRGPANDPGGDTRRGRLPFRRTAPGRRRDRLPPVPGGMMADLFWPGDERAATAFEQGDFLETMVEVERVWFHALQRAGLAPEVGRRRAGRAGHEGGPRRDRHEGRGEWQPRRTARGADARTARRTRRDRCPVAAPRAHQPGRARHCAGPLRPCHARVGSRRPRPPGGGALGAGRATPRRPDGRTDADPARRTHHLRPQGGAVAPGSPRCTRRPARAAGSRSRSGGAAGTLAAVTELTGDADAAQALVAEVAQALQLDPAPPWHTSRAPFTRYADALVRANDAWGHIANDVLLLARPEIAELAEPAVEGRGGSSTMPQKANPVLSLLIRRAALAAPGHAAQLHLAAATTVDERPDGAWHTEWSTLAALSRHTLTAGVADDRAAGRAARRHRQDGRRGQATVLGPAGRAAQHPRACPRPTATRTRLRPQPLPRRDRQR